MKKILVTLISLFAIAQFSYAQNTFPSSGNVGIGTTSPTQTLSLQNATIPAIDFYTGIYNRATISASSSLLTFNSVTSNPISFQINSSERMRIDGGGNVGIGTTSPSQMLSVGSGSPFNVTSAGAVTNAGETVNNGVIQINSATYIPLSINSTYGQVGLQFGNNGSYFAGIGSASNVTTAYTGSTSDLGLGTNGSATGNIIFATGSGYSEGMRLLYNGNVGIGTTSPGALLHVSKDGGGGDVELARFEGTNASDHPYITLGNPVTPYHARYIMYNKSTDVMTIDRHGGSAATIALAVNSGGKVGIGTTSPAYKLDVNGNMNVAQGITFGGENYKSTNTSGYFVAVNNGTNNGLYWDATNSILSLYVNSGSGGISINNSGYVGIGTTTPREALSVNGNIRSKQVKVELANWPDYVFKSAYILPSLTKVKTYINKYHHLPDMPSEKEVAESGLNLGEVDKQLTKKVEELTLYLIEQNKQIIKQNKLIADQQKINQSLQEQINNLAKQRSH